MKTTRLMAFAALVSAAVACSPKGPAPVQDARQEARIEKILKGLTLEEKIGQMTQLNIDLFIDNDRQIDEAKLDTIIRIYKVGSILNVPASTATSREDYARIIGRIQEISMKEIGVPCLYGLDQIHGATYTEGATFFPQEVNLAASFDRTHAINMGNAIAYETRASMVPWTFSPVMDLGREPRWSRMWESFGEDPYLNAEMAVAETRAMQGDNPLEVDLYHVAACLKHYMCYGVPRSGMDRTPSSVTPTDMREKYFKPFKECCEAGALSIMVNSASNNGMPFHANRELLTGWVKEDLGWDGLIVTDWADIVNLYTREMIANDEQDAIRLAINAGIDMSMVPYSWSFCEKLKACVEAGEVPMSRIDDACRRVLRVKMRLGLFENPTWDASAYDRFGCKEFCDQALAAAVASEVLLKNEDGVLPIKEGSRILVAGPNGNSMRTLNGGWSYTWQGEKTDVLAADYNTIYEALANRFGAGKVSYVPGVSYYGKDWQADRKDRFDEAVAAARNADVVVVCVGENSYCETPGNITDLNLSSNQKDLVKALAATGKPVVMILNEGRPRIISDIEPLAKAVVDVLLPGNYGGDALAMLLAGDANFSAKLPFTYPCDITFYTTYDYKVSEHTGTMAGAYNYDATITNQWSFGFGLSYTGFEYSNLRASKTEFTAADELEFSVDVKNVGQMDGAEAVLLYTSDLVASSIPDVKRLRGFEKVNLAAGESTTVTFRIPAKDLAFVGYDGTWHLEKGAFRIACGNQVVMIECTETKDYGKKNI